MSPAADIALRCSRCSATVMFDMFIRGATSGDVACPRRLATTMTMPATTATSRRILNIRIMSVLQMLYFLDPALRLVFFAAFFFGDAFFFAADFRFGVDRFALFFFVPFFFVPFFFMGF